MAKNAPIEYTRTLTKRATEKSTWDGDVGEVTFGIADSGFTVNGQPVPQSSTEYLLHGLGAVLSSVYNSVDTLEQAQAAFDEKIAKLIDGDVTIRGEGGEGPDEYTTSARIVMRRNFLKAVGGRKSDKYAAFSALSDAEKTAQLDKWFEQNAENPDLLAEVGAEVAKREEIARVKKASGATGKVGASLNF